MFRKFLSSLFFIFLFNLSFCQTLYLKEIKDTSEVRLILFPHFNDSVLTVKYGFCIRDNQYATPTFYDSKFILIPSEDIFYSEKKWWLFRSKIK